MGCCKNIKLKEIIHKEKVWTYIFIYVSQYSKTYVCENCGKTFK